MLVSIIKTPRLVSIAWQTWFREGDITHAKTLKSSLRLVLVAFQFVYNITELTIQILKN